MTRRRTVRLALIGAANLAALFCLWRLSLADRSDVAAESRVQAERAVGAASAPERAPAARAPDAPSRSSPMLSTSVTSAPPAKTSSTRASAPSSAPSATRATSTSPARAPHAGTVAGEPALAPLDPARKHRGDAGLEARVKKHVAEAQRRALDIANGRLRPGEASVAIAVHELGVAGHLVSIGADRSMRPASNMKLVTSAAALVLLGPDWSFDTVFDTTAPILDGRVRGDVVVHAAGDPLLDWDAEGEVDAFLEPIAAGLLQRGVRSIDGALCLDEGGFQPPAPGPAWPSEKDHWEEYCALAGGFSANAGCLTIVVHASQSGGAARVEVHPRDHGYTRRIAVRTVGAKQRLDVRVDLRNGELRVEGAIPKDVPQWTARISVPDPVELFGRVVVGGLRARGIAVEGGWKRGPVARDERTAGGDDAGLAPGAVELCRLRTPLVDTLIPINTHSHNACADQVFLAMGNALSGEGTRAGGRAATARALTKLGVSTEGLVQVDGSGLSRDNRVSARQIAALIDAVLRVDARTSQLFLDSLAVAAETGTLDGRMKKGDLAGRVRAKTGFINGTGALSGLIETRAGRMLVFSILVEYPTIEGLNKRCWKPMEDAICEELAGWDG